MSLFFRVSGIALVLLVFMAAGVLIGAQRPSPKNPADTERFRLLSDDRAFDTKTGKTCLVNIQMPKGFKLDGPTPSCSELAEQ